MSYCEDFQTVWDLPEDHAEFTNPKTIKSSPLGLHRLDVSGACLSEPCDRPEDS